MCAEGDDARRAALASITEARRECSPLCLTVFPSYTFTSHTTPPHPPPSPRECQSLPALSPASFFDALSLPSNVESVRLVYDPEGSEVDDSFSEGKPSTPLSSSGSLPILRSPSGKRPVRLVVRTKVPLVGWLLLFGAMVASQSGGAVVNMQAFSSRGEDLFLRMAWRGMCTATFMAGASVVHDGR